MKYKLLTEETMEITRENKATLEGETMKLYRIQATETFVNKATGNEIKAGDKGGWVSQDGLLSHEGTCWLGEEAKLFHREAEVCGDAYVGGHAEVYESAMIRVTALVTDNAKVHGYSVVKGHAVIKGNANVSGMSNICGNAQISDHAEVSGLSKFEPYTVVGGEYCVTGTAKVWFGHYVGRATLESGTWYGEPAEFDLGKIHVSVAGDSTVAVVNTDVYMREVIDLSTAREFLRELVRKAVKKVHGTIDSEAGWNWLDQLSAAMWNVWVTKNGFCNVVQLTDLEDRYHVVE